METVRSSNKVLITPPHDRCSPGKSFGRRKKKDHSFPTREAIE